MRLLPSLALTIGLTGPAGSQPAAGEYGVGYRVLNGTPTVHVWYPSSARAQARPMRLADYLDDKGTATAAFLSGAGIPRAAVDSFLNVEGWAVREVAPLSRAFPVLLVAQGNAQRAFDQAKLCELLASHGFIVATTPSPMLRTPMERLDQMAPLAEEQAKDLLQALTRVAEVAQPRERVIVIGHSFGARSALLVAMREPRVRGIISLDGGIGTSTGIAELRAAPSFDARAQLPPIVHVYEELDAYMKPDFTFLRSLRADTLVLEPTTNLHHAHFTIYGFAAGRFGDIGRVTGGTAGTAAEVGRVSALTLDWVRRLLAR